MTDKHRARITPLSGVDIRPRHPTWHGRAWVVEREILDQETRKYLNVELEVGSRSLAMPLWLVDDVVEALQRAKVLAEQYRSSLPDVAAPHDP